MWPFRKSITILSSGVLKGMTDWHCHLLPGVDDGVQTIEESLELLRLYEEVGICEVWLTPHVMEDIPNTTETLQLKYEELVKAYKGNITLHLAAEYMLDAVFEERLLKNDLLTLGIDQNLLLVETSYYNPPMNLYQLLDKIKELGYQPLLAHPERYLYMQESDYTTLKGKGILFQLNLFSLGGKYGKDVQKKAEWLYSHNMIHLIGTDTHGQQQFLENIQGKFSISLKQDKI